LTKLLLGFWDLLIAAKNVAYHKMDHMSSQLFLTGLLNCGIQMGPDPEDDIDPSLEASMAYTGAIGVTLLDEINFANERIDTRALVSGNHDTLIDGLCE
jgi:hypothetical protein